MAKISTKRLLSPWHLGLPGTKTAAQLVVNNPNRIIQHPGKQRPGLHRILIKTNPLAGKLHNRAEPVSRSRHRRPEKRRSGGIEGDRKSKSGAGNLRFRFEN